MLISQCVLQHFWALSLIKAHAKNKLEKTQFSKRLKNRWCFRVVGVPRTLLFNMCFVFVFIFFTKRKLLNSACFLRQMVALGLASCGYRDINSK